MLRFTAEACLYSSPIHYATTSSTSSGSVIGSFDPKYCDRDQLRVCRALVEADVRACPAKMCRGVCSQQQGRSAECNACLNRVEATCSRDRVAELRACERTYGCGRGLECMMDLANPEWGYCCPSGTNACGRRCLPRCKKNAVRNRDTCVCECSRPPFTTRCPGGSCVDILKDAANCGGCGSRCRGDEVCCNGECVDLDTDEDHCGDCEVTCRRYETCCNGECVNIQTNEQHCGNCTTVCPSNRPDCCGGECVNLDTNEAHCGSCNNTCQGNDRCCSGECVNIQTNEQHCGGCHNECPSERPDCCGGECVNKNFHMEHCGRCGRRCEYYETCCYGNCVYLDNDERYCGDCETRCLPGQTCCDGMCLNPEFFNTSKAHCGSCNNSCPGDYICCNGECVDPYNDTANCGECGNTCSSDQTCCEGSCVNPELFKDDPENCGSCGNRCSGFESDCCSGRCKNLEDIGATCIDGETVCLYGKYRSRCPHPWGGYCCCPVGTSCQGLNNDRRCVCY